MNGPSCPSRSSPPAETDDPDIVIKVAIERKQYRRALELLAKSYAARLGRLCQASVGNRAEAEELVQEILLAAHSAMPGFEGRSGVRSWLYTIARRACGHHLDKRTRRRQLLDGAFTPPSSPADPCQQTLARAEEERLRQALAQLPAGAREVLLLRYSGGLSFRDVAAACGIREEAARQRASAGLRLLRRKLDETGRDNAADVAEPVGQECQEVSR